MEAVEKETIDFDTSFDIECIIYDALKATISQSIDAEMEKDDNAPIIAKEAMLKNILSRNIDGLEEEQYLTVGAEGKLYLCGSWLMRSVLSTDGTMKPMLEHIKQTTDCTNIVFLPNKTGAELRKELWFAQTEGYSSYDLPRECRINPPPAMPPRGSMMGRMPGMASGMPPMGFGGPPPGAMGMPPLGAGGPPPGMMGMPPMGAPGAMGMPPKGRPPVPPPNIFPFEPVDE